MSFLIIWKYIVENYNREYSVYYWRVIEKTVGFGLDRTEVEQ